MNEKYEQIPERILTALKAWNDRAQWPGDFLVAVLSNDLMGAMGRADLECRAALPAITAYIYNHMRADCHGSPERMLEFAEAMWRTDDAD